MGFLCTGKLKKELGASDIEDSCYHTVITKPKCEQANGANPSNKDTCPYQTSLQHPHKQEQDTMRLRLSKPTYLLHYNLKLHTNLYYEKIHN